FSSLFDYKMATHQEKYPVLQQHFVGWTVKTKNPVFDTDQATYMDFSIPQKGNTRFMYVLPFSQTEALVEYTLFSKKLLPKMEYENAIREYLGKMLNTSANLNDGPDRRNLENMEAGPGIDENETQGSEPNLADYEILDTEQGSIPMTCYDFSEHHTSNIRYIGTAGGWAKPSTGYTFMSSSKKVPVLVEHVKNGQPLDRLSFKNKFWYYDLLFLDVLYKNNGKGHHVFETLFKNRDPQLIFKFLDEESSFWEDLLFILGCPTWPFVKAMFERIITMANTKVVR
ncbi:MAG: lycopene cyclase family protein, partial [Pricia sp.]